MSLTRTLIDVGPLRTSPVFRQLLIGRTVSTLGSFSVLCLLAVTGAAAATPELRGGAATPDER